MAQNVGVNGTPAFFVNGRMLSGAQPVEAFKSVIDAELAEQGLPPTDRRVAEGRPHP